MSGLPVLVRWLRASSVIALVAGASPGGVAPDSLPPRLPAPPQDALLVDTFASLDAWQPDRPDAWTIERGVLCAHLPDAKQERSLAYAGSEEWGDYAVDLDLCQVRGVDKGVIVRVRGGQGTGVDLRGGSYQDVLVYRRSRPLGKAKVPNADGRWHHLRIEARGNRYAVYVDSQLALECRDPVPGVRRGRIALAAYTGGTGQCGVLYANVVVTPLAGK